MSYWMDKTNVAERQFDLAGEIKQRVSIEDLCSRLGFEPNRSGFVHSIYHTEKTPSLKIYPESNTFYDYSSSQGGSVIDFWMGFYNCDFKTAIDDLAKLYGIGRNTENFIKDVPAKKVRTKEENIFDCMTDEEHYVYEERSGIAGVDVALREVKLLRLQRNQEVFYEFMNYCLEHSFDVEAFKYLTHTRKLVPETISDFRLFNIKDYWQVNNHLKKRFPIEQLQKSGLYNVKEDGSGNLIFASHRIIIPYYFNDRIVYLRARYFNEGSADPKENGWQKYLALRNDALNVNTPKRFFNRDVLRGMFQGQKLYITEGEFDAIMMEQEGYNAIAIPGAGNMPDVKKFEHLKNLDVIVVPDNDEAGEGLLKKIEGIFALFGKTVKVKRLPVKDVSEFFNN